MVFEPKIGWDLTPESSLSPKSPGTSHPQIQEMRALLMKERTNERTNKHAHTHNVGGGYSGSV